MLLAEELTRICLLVSRIWKWWASPRNVIQNYFSYVLFLIFIYCINSKLSLRLMRIKQKKINYSSVKTNAVPLGAFFTLTLGTKLEFSYIKTGLLTLNELLFVQPYVLLVQPVSHINIIFVDFAKYLEIELKCDARIPLTKGDWLWNVISVEDVILKSSWIGTREPDNQATV